MKLRFSMNLAAYKFQKSYRAFREYVSEDNLEPWCIMAGERMQTYIKDVEDYSTELVFYGELARKAANTI